MCRLVTHTTYVHTYLCSWDHHRLIFWKQYSLVPFLATCTDQFCKYVMQHIPRCNFEKLCKIYKNQLHNYFVFSLHIWSQRILLLHTRYLIKLKLDFKTGQCWVLYRQKELLRYSHTKIRFTKNYLPSNLNNSIFFHNYQSKKISKPTKMALTEINQGRPVGLGDNINTLH